MCFYWCRDKHHLFHQYEYSNIRAEQNKISISDKDRSIDGLIKEKSSGTYSLQSGAFSVQENAEGQKINLIHTGFDARVTELYRNNQILYAVRVGYYKDEKDAKQIGRKIKIKLALDTIVITNQ